MEKEIFLQALGLTSPWYIKDFQLDVEKERVDIYLDFEKGSKFTNIDGNLVGVEQTENKTWKHLFFWQYPTYLHCRVPKLKNKDGKVKMIKLPWAREGSGFTLLFESMVLELLKHMPTSKLAEHLQENDERLMRLAKYYVTKSREKADYSNIKKLGIDETSKKKGHNYISTGVNLETRKVASIVEGKGKDSVEDIAKDIEKHGGDRNNITDVAIDFSPSFTAGVLESFSSASISYDPFHFNQFISKGLDEVRKKEAKANKILKGTKHLWLKNYDNLKDENKLKIEELKKENIELAEAYQMKENIKNLYNQETKEDAELLLTSWCEWVMSSKIEPMKKVVNTIKAHWSGIINSVEKHINSGIVEGLNSIIQTIKRRARGYKNIDNFKTMIYLKIGDFPILSSEDIT